MFGFRERIKQSVCVLSETSHVKDAVLEAGTLHVANPEGGTFVR